VYLFTFKGDRVLRLKTMKMCPDKAGNVLKLAKKVNNIMCNKSGKVWGF
jgi:hypothetical protein